MPVNTAPARRAGRSRSAGSLAGDLGLVALNLQHALKHVDIVVWADREAQVHFAEADRCPAVGADDLIGTYGAAARRADIEADLAVMRGERVSSAMIG